MRKKNILPRGIQKLPIELLQAIASYLPASDLCTFWLAYKSISNDTFFYVFRCKFFREVHSDLSLRSLKRTENIARDPKLAPHVHSLIVKFVDDSENRLGEGLTWNRSISGHLEPDADVERWGAVLRGLVNCTSFHLIRHG